LLHKRGYFLPHAALLKENGEIKLIGSAPATNNDQTDAAKILPVLHGSLCVEWKAVYLMASGSAENVSISPEEDELQTQSFYL
jgi:hypothetical protein